MSNITTNLTMFTLGLVIAFGLAHVFSSAPADPSTLFDNQCVDCHELSDFEGIVTSELTEYLLGTLDGTYNHPPTDLTADQATLMAEYLASQ